MNGRILTDPLLTHWAKNGVFRAVLSAPTKKAQTYKLRPFNHLAFKAGERIRTADVQLGNSMLRLQTLVRTALMCCFSVENEDCKRLTG